MKGFFDKMTGKTSKAEQAAVDEKRRQDEIFRQQEISRLAVEKAKSPEGQKWRQDLQKQKIAEIEQDIRLREQYLRLFNKSSGETDPELLKLKRDLENIKNGVTTDFNLRLSELRDANPPSSMPMSMPTNMSMSMPMPMPMNRPSIPDNYDPFKPYKPKQPPASNNLVSRQFRAPESFDESKAIDEIQQFDLDSPVSKQGNVYKVPSDFDEEKAMQDLNDEDFDGGKRRRRRTKRRRPRKTRKSRKSKKSKTGKKNRMSKKSKTLKY